MAALLHVVKNAAEQTAALRRVLEAVAEPTTPRNRSTQYVALNLLLVRFGGRPGYLHDEGPESDPTELATALGLCASECLAPYFEIFRGSDPTLSRCSAIAAFPTMRYYSRRRLTHEECVMFESLSGKLLGFVAVGGIPQNNTMDPYSVATHYYCCCRTGHDGKPIYLTAEVAPAGFDADRGYNEAIQRAVDRMNAVLHTVHYEAYVIQKCEADLSIWSTPARDLGTGGLGDKQKALASKFREAVGVLRTRRAPGGPVEAAHERLGAFREDHHPASRAC
jgi:hypothetical protein